MLWEAQLIPLDEKRIENVRTYHNIITPYGRVSKLQIGEKGDKKVLFISRHGRNREYSPLMCHILHICDFCKSKSN